jgi:hypothetical protein
MSNTEITETKGSVRGRWKLERLANIAIVVAAAAITITNVYQRLVPRTALPSPPNQNFEEARAAATELVGKEFTLPKGYNGGTGATVVLFLSDTCHFCTASVPFYQRLASIHSSAPEEFSIATFFSPREGRDAGSKYLERNRVIVESIESVDFSSLNIRVTPTVLLLDGNHRVKAVWTGLLPPANEGKLISNLKELCKKCVEL